MTKSRKRLTEQEKKLFIQMVNDGTSASRLSELFKCSLVTVHRRVKSYGLPKIIYKPEKPKADLIISLAKEMQQPVCPKKIMVETGATICYVQMLLRQHDIEYKLSQGWLDNKAGIKPEKKVKTLRGGSGANLTTSWNDKAFNKFMGIMK
jgi:transposase